MPAIITIYQFPVSFVGKLTRHKLMIHSQYFFHLERELDTINNILRRSSTKTIFQSNKKMSEFLRPFIVLKNSIFSDAIEIQNMPISIKKMVGT